MSRTFAVVLRQGDITTAEVDVIVNAANPSLLGGGGVDGAIHRAGGPEILAACRERKKGLPGGLLPRGQAVATTAGRLPARWVIHTPGPVWSSTEDRSAVLRSSYVESMRLAARLGATSIAFPAISAGVYGWPLDDAARIALRSVRAAWDAGTRPDLDAGSPPTDPWPLHRVTFVLYNRSTLEAFQRALSDLNMNLWHDES